MTSPTYQSDDNDPVMQMLRTGQVAPSAEASSTASASTPVASSDDSDPVMRMLRTGSADSGAAAAPAKRKYISPVDDPSTRSGQGGIAGNITDAVDATVGNIVQGTVGAIGGGYRGLVAWLRGRGMDEAADEVNNFQARTAYQPSSPVAEKTTEVMQSPWNPLNLPTTVGHGLGRGAEYLGAPPSVSATLEAVPTAASALYGMRNGVMRGGDKPMEGMPLRRSFLRFLVKIRHSFRLCAIRLRLRLRPPRSVAPLYRYPGMQGRLRRLPRLARRQHCQRRHSRAIRSI